MSTRAAPPRRPDGADRSEVDKFDRLAASWWDPRGPMRPLHRINSVRLAYLREEVCRHLGRDGRDLFLLDGLRVLDVGCGAGLLSEPLARLGGDVVGLDPGRDTIAAAQRHAAEGGLSIDYRQGTVEGVGEEFDLVVAMEVVEHVPDVPAFLRACAAATRPGGLVLLSTINRTLRAFALAIVGAEYVLRWLPRGTHDWEKLVTPAELRQGAEAAGLARFRARGLVFDPLQDEWRLSDDTAVNYLARVEKPA